MVSRFTLFALVGSLFPAVLNAQTVVPSRTDFLGDPLPAGVIARLGTLRFKHDPAQNSLIWSPRFSPDGKMVVSLTHSVRIWEAATGKEIKGPWNNQQNVSVAFSQNSKLLATSVYFHDNGEEIILYDIPRAKVVKAFGRLPGVSGTIAFADGGKTIVSASWEAVNWFDVASGKKIRSWRPRLDDEQQIDEADRKNIGHCVLAPDGEFMAAHVTWRPKRPRKGQAPFEGSGEVVGFDLVRRKVSWRSSAGILRSFESNPIAFSANGKYVAIGAPDNKLEVREISTGQVINSPSVEFYDSKSNAALALSYDGEMVATGDAKSRFVLWNVREPSRPRKFAVPGAVLCPTQRNLQFSPDNKTLLVAADNGLRLYDVASLREQRPFDGHYKSITSLRFSADGCRLMTGSWAETIVWNARTWKLLQSTSIPDPLRPHLGTMAPDQAVYAGDGRDRNAFYDVKTGKLLARVDVPSDQVDRAHSFFSPGGRFFGFHVWEREKDKSCLRLFTVPSGKLACSLPCAASLGFSADEQLVAMIVSQNDTIQVYETATGKLFRQLGVKAKENDTEIIDRSDANFAFSRDGKYLATSRGFESAIHEWSLTTGREIMQIAEPLIEAGYGLQFAWSPDGRLLAIGQEKIRVWELASSTVRCELPGHADGPILAMSFTPDGKLLATGSADTTVLIWDVSLPQLSAKKIGGDAKLLKQRWQALGQADAAQAYSALAELVATPSETVAWIKSHLLPAQQLDGKKVEQLIARLGDEHYQVRQKAMAELEHIGERIVPALDKALAANPVLETQRRLQELHQRMTSLAVRGERLQAFRAVEVLERIGTREARQVLASLAGGAPGALATAQAQAALERLGE